MSAKEKFGKIDGLIHAAGNLADKKIEDKKLEDYEKVVEVKVDGLRNLIVNLDMDKIKYCILFSSVSGFYGNRGQVDYSMANEILNKYAYKLKNDYKIPFVKSINWGPWESGMVNDSLKSIYESQGIEVLSKEAGTKFFIDELSSDPDDIQVIISGPWLGESA